MLFVCLTLSKITGRIRNRFESEFQEMLKMCKAPSHLMLVIFWFAEELLNQVAFTVKEATMLCNLVLLLSVSMLSYRCKSQFVGEMSSLAPFHIVTNDHSKVFTCVCLCVSGQSVHLGMGGSWSCALPRHLWTLCHILPGLLYILLHWRVSGRSSGISR